MELDDLKSAWKSIPEKNSYQQKDIFEMMKKKSSSTIKWLFIFTSIEFLIVIFFTIYTLTTRKVLINKNTNDLFSYNNYLIGSIFTIITTLIFLYITYKIYKKININSSISELVNQIIKFRKIVNIFILVILISLSAISIPYYFHLGIDIYINKTGINYNPEKAKLIGYISATIAIVFLLIITTIYYSVIYFLFLKKLANNLKHLKDVN